MVCNRKLAFLGNELGGTHLGFGGGGGPGRGGGGSGGLGGEGLGGGGSGGARAGGGLGFPFGGGGEGRGGGRLGGGGPDAATTAAASCIGAAQVASAPVAAVTAVSSWPCCCTALSAGPRSVVAQVSLIPTRAELPAAGLAAPARCVPATAATLVMVAAGRGMLPARQRAERDVRAVCRHACGGCQRP